MYLPKALYQETSQQKNIEHATFWCNLGSSGSSQILPNMEGTSCTASNIKWKLVLEIQCGWLCRCICFGRWRWLSGTPCGLSASRSLPAIPPGLSRWCYLWLVPSSSLSGIIRTLRFIICICSASCPVGCSSSNPVLIANNTNANLRASPRRLNLSNQNVSRTSV